MALFGLSLNVTPEESRAFWKVLTGLKEKKINTVGFQFDDNTSLFFDVKATDFDCVINSQNKQIGEDTVIDSMYAVQVKGTIDATI